MRSWRLTMPQPSPLEPTDGSRPPDETDWTMNTIAHTRLLNEIRAERRAAGDTVLQEGQGSFRLRRPSGLVISGQPDLIALSDGSATVYEAKTGRRRGQDRIQVMIYMHCLRQTNRALHSVSIRGEIRYGDGGGPLRIESDAVLGEFESHFDYFMRLFESEKPPERVPSAMECGWCNIAPPDCPDRLDAPTDDTDEIDIGPF